MSGGELVIMCYDEGADDIVRDKRDAVVSYYVLSDSHSLKRR